DAGTVEAVDRTGGCLRRLAHDGGSLDPALVLVELAALRDERSAIDRPEQQLADLLPREVEDVVRPIDRARLDESRAGPQREATNRVLGHAIDPVVVDLGDRPDPAREVEQPLELLPLPLLVCE